MILLLLLFWTCQAEFALWMVNIVDLRLLCEISPTRSIVGYQWNHDMVSFSTCFLQNLYLIKIKSSSLKKHSCSHPNGDTRQLVRVFFEYFFLLFLLLFCMFSSNLSCEEVLHSCSKTFNIYREKLLDEFKWKPLNLLVKKTRADWKG